MSEEQLQIYYDMMDAFKDLTLEEERNGQSTERFDCLEHEFCDLEITFFASFEEK